MLRASLQSATRMAFQILLLGQSISNDDRHMRPLGGFDGENGVDGPLKSQISDFKSQISDFNSQRQENRFQWSRPRVRPRLSSAFSRCQSAIGVVSPPLHRCVCATHTLHAIDWSNDVGLQSWSFASY